MPVVCPIRTYHICLRQHCYMNIVQIFDGSTTKHTLSDGIPAAGLQPQ